LVRLEPCVERMEYELVLELADPYHGPSAAVASELTTEPPTEAVTPRVAD
jgi:hypothetical protein